MTKATCLYDLSKEVTYSPEDLDVFSMVWNRNREDTLSNKIIVQAADELLLIEKPTPFQMKWGAIVRVTAVAAAIVLAFVSFILAILVISGPARLTFWKLTLSLSAFGMVIGLIDYVLGGK